MTLYDLEAKRVVWTGREATTLAVSADGSTVAAVDRDADYAVLYNTEDGTELAVCSLPPRPHPPAPVHWSSILPAPGPPVSVPAALIPQKLAVVYGYEAAVFELGDRKRITVLPVKESALSDCLFTDEDLKPKCQKGRPAALWYPPP